MYAGQIVERGATDEVLQNPLHPYTQLLLSAVPNPGAGLTGARVVPHRATAAVSDSYAGCRFVGRCPVAIRVCSDVVPELIEAPAGHRVRCHLYEPSTTERRGEA